MKKKYKKIIKMIPFSDLPIQLYKKAKCLATQRNERKELKRLSTYSKDQHKIFYLGIPYHTNIGDLAQTYCTRIWLRDNFPDYIVIEEFDKIIVNHKESFVEVFQRILGNDDYIFFQSGYNTQDIGGRQDEMHRFICENFSYAKIIFLPQTVLFLNKDNQDRTSKSCLACKNMLFLGRDARSTETAKEMFPNIPVYPYPDIVTTLIGQFSFNDQRSDILFCIRNDLEKFYSDDELSRCAESIGKETGINVVFADTDIDEENKTMLNNLKYYIEKEISFFSKYSLVITDRYHGTIFSIIANTPVIVIKSNDHKVSTGVDWFKGVYDNRVFLAENLDQAVVLVKGILKQRSLPPPPPYFKEHYYDTLKDLIIKSTSSTEND